MAYDCFSDEAVIPLLLNGQEISNAFGMTSNTDFDNSLRYGVEIPIQIMYGDLEKKRYVSYQILKVKTSEVFGNSLWGEPKKV